MSIYPSPAPGSLPFDEVVARLPLPVALERVFRARATGLIVMEAKPGKHAVYIRDGYPVAVELPGSFELLGKVLVEMKILDETTYKKSLEAPPPTGMRYGEVLLSQGLVTDEQLRQALKAQVRRKLHRLYFLTDSSISFSSSTHQEGLQNNESMRVHPWRANYHGVRSAWNADRLRLALGSIFNRPLRTALSTEDMARFGLGADDGRVGAMLRTGAPSVDALSLDSGLPLQPVSALVYALYVAEALDDGAAVIPAAAPVVSNLPAQSGRTSPAVPVMNPSAPATYATAAPVPAPSPLSPAALELEQIVTARVADIDDVDLFAVLGVARDATPEQIKTAYFDAARRFHPDRLASLGLERIRPQVEKIFRRVSEAQATLLDDARRAAYQTALDNPKSPAEVAAQKQALAALQAEMAFKRGQHHLKKNDLELAVRELEAAVNDHPQEGEYLVYLAWARHCAQKLSLTETVTEMNRALKLQPKCASGYYYLGMLHKESGADENALAHFRKAVSLDDRQFDAEQEIRVLEARRARNPEKRGLFDRFRKPGK